MTNHELEISPELIAAVDELVQRFTGHDLEALQMICQARNPEDEITIQDVVSDILQAGDVHKPDDAQFEDGILIGAFEILGGEIYF